MSDLPVMNVLQTFALLVAAGSSLVMAIVVLRWSASLEARVMRMDSLLDRVRDGSTRMSVSE